MSETVTQPRLETARLILEEFEDSDVEDIFAYSSNPEITRYVFFEAHQTREDSKKFLQFARDQKRTERGKVRFVFAIRDKASAKVIGSISFAQIRSHVGQLDYALAKEHWSRGVMTEAAMRVRDWALTMFPEIVRLQSYCAVENVGSWRVMQKLE